MDANAKRWARPLKAGRPSEMVLPEGGGNRVVRVGRLSNYLQPLNFIRRRTKCECGASVEFIHKEYAVCLGCCVREGYIAGPFIDTTSDLTDERPESSASDEEIADRIRIAHELREGLGTDEGVMPLLQKAMEGGKGKRRKEFVKYAGVPASNRDIDKGDRE